jgi:hypothetical protein
MGIKCMISITNHSTMGSQSAPVRTPILLLSCCRINALRTPGRSAFSADSQLEEENARLKQLPAERLRKENSELGKKLGRG